MNALKIYSLILGECMRNSMKKSVTALVLAGTLGALFALPAVAAPDSADAGFFVSGQIGRSRYDIGSDGFGNDFGKKNGTIGGVGIGYAFNPIIAVELSYNDYGKVNFGGVDGRAKSPQLSALLSAPIADAFSVYGRLGVSDTDRKVSGFGGSVSEKKTEAIYGVGFGYNFVKNIKGTIEYQKLDDSKVDALVAGVKFGF
jgi:opacity protein-like surface antigen